MNEQGNRGGTFEDALRRSLETFKPFCYQEQSCLLNGSSAKKFSESRQLHVSFKKWANSSSSGASNLNSSPFMLADVGTLNKTSTDVRLHCS